MEMIDYDTITSFEKLVRSRRAVVKKADAKWNEVVSAAEKVRKAATPFNIISEMIRGSVSALLRIFIVRH